LIVHLVLFTPRPDLSDAERVAVRDTLDHALTSIPAIRNYKVGRRLRLGTTYDRVAPLDFEFLVTIEVEDEQALSEYLAHPAHQKLGHLFYEASAHALACDFKLGEISDLHDLQ
jgi:Stress responsive A/B Barrel Domain